MDTKSTGHAGTRRSPAHRVVRMVGAALAASIISIAVAGSALAATVTNSGCVGVVWYPQATGTDLYGDAIMMGRFTVDRSPCYAGTQVVTVTVRQWGYDFSLDRWVVVNPSLRPSSGSNTVQLGSGQYGWVDFGHLYAARYRNVAIDATVTWRTTGGQLIGRTYLDYNGSRDYYCHPAVSPDTPPQCQVAWVSSVGAYIHFVW